MSQQVDAIFDNGVLKPLTPIVLPDKSRVKVTIDTTSPDQAAAQSPDGSIGGDDFEKELEPLLFEGPTVPPDFSRADIYDDHD